ncbi:MAG: 50S ribosomal protein L32 [Patescibacteria group bacterium]
MAEPKKKLSKTRTNLRRSTYAVPGTGMARCSNCKEVILPHIICPHCGWYGGKPTRLSKIKRITAEKPDVKP